MNSDIDQIKTELTDFLTTKGLTGEDLEQELRKIDTKVIAGVIESEITKLSPEARENLEKIDPDSAGAENMEMVLELLGKTPQELQEAYKQKLTEYKDQLVNQVSQAI